MKVLQKLENYYTKFIGECGYEPTEILTNEKTVDKMVDELEEMLDRKFPREDNLRYRGIPIKINDAIPTEMFHLIRK